MEQLKLPSSDKLNETTQVLDRCEKIIRMEAVANRTRIPKPANAKVVELPLRSVEPYRLLFPMGLLFSILASSLWMLFKTRLLQIYPAGLHGDFMVGGFLLSYAMGFLMTAIPRFTVTRPAGTDEVLAAVTLQLLALGTLIIRSRILAHELFLLEMIALDLFAISRFVTRQMSPPTPFMFVGIALAAGTLGSFLFVSVDLGASSPALYSTACLLFYQAMMLSFILGIGAKLIRAILGWGPHPLAELSTDRKRSETLEFLLLSIAFVLSFLTEIYLSMVAGRTLRALVVTYVAIKMWKIHRRPKSTGFLALGLYFSCLSTVIGSWVIACIPSLSIHGLHFLFIGGFGLMTLMIGARVTTAHAINSVLLVQKSKIILFIIVSFVLATLFRVCAPLASDFYWYGLIISASFWIAGSIAWAVSFIPKMLR